MPDEVRDVTFVNSGLMAFFCAKYNQKCIFCPHVGLMSSVDFNCLRGKDTWRSQESILHCVPKVVFPFRFSLGGSAMEEYIIGYCFVNESEKQILHFPMCLRRECLTWRTPLKVDHFCGLAQLCKMLHYCLWLWEKQANPAAPQLLLNQVW